MYKLIVVLILLFSIVQSSYGQTISITSFCDLPDDMSAVYNETTVIDQNGEKCALIKVETTQTGFSFDVGTLGVVKTSYRPGEVWVYVPYGVKRISIAHPSYGVLRDFNFPHALEKGKTYLLQLCTEATSQNATKVAPEPLKISDNLQKTVLFSLGENEVIYCNEHYADFNGKFDRFACIVSDTISKRQKFIVNGECLAEGKIVYVSYINLDDPSKCIFSYGDSDVNLQYLNIEGTLYGPYESVMSIADPFRRPGYKGPQMLGLDKPYRVGWLYKNLFCFGQMGREFLYNNGNIITIPDKYYFYEDGKKRLDPSKIIEDVARLSQGVSPNGIYKIKHNGRRLVGNNLNYLLPFTPDKDDNTFLVFNNGNAIIDLCENKGSAWVWHPYFVNLNTGKIRKINDDEECIDYQHGNIMPKPSSWDRQFERKNNKLDYDVIRHEIFVQDPSLQHFMLSNLRYPYVLIDNQKVGNACAIDATYNPKNNCFVWHAFEDNEIALYIYYL